MRRGRPRPAPRLPTPTARRSSASTRSERVTVPGARRFEIAPCGHHHEFHADASMPPRRCRLRRSSPAMSRSARARLRPARRASSAAAIAASISLADAPASAAYAGDDHGLVQSHCVTGIAGRQPVFAADADRRATARCARARRRALRGGQSAAASVSQRHRIDHQAAAGTQRRDRRIEHAGVLRRRR